MAEHSKTKCPLIRLYKGGENAPGLPAKGAHFVVKMCRRGRHTLFIIYYLLSIICKAAFTGKAAIFICFVSAFGFH